MKINISIIHHSFRYETEKLCRIFFPNDEFSFSEIPYEGDESSVLTQVIRLQPSEIRTEIRYNGNKKENSRIVYRESGETDEAYDKRLERALALCLYDGLCAVTGYTPPWGILTGVRPAKLMSRYLSAYGAQGAKDAFIRELHVSPEKAELALEVAQRESRITALSTESSFSLYVSVPFCPTRCSYCSFVSHSNAQAKKLIPDYVSLLCEEIAQTGRIARRLGLRLETVYYGGGTPTVLTHTQLAQVMQAVQDSFELSHIREYTVEAGRPDSITPEKLQVIKAGGADRISINPQTFDDGILRLIGRQHTCEQTLQAYAMARQAGIGNINMDLIAGLPSDTLEGFTDTLEKTVSLAPESITVHTLSLKRSSRLVTDEKKEVDADGIALMLSRVGERLYPLGYRPYYMYRQSKTAGNMENVGWAKEGYESLYNVYMMEESHTVLGVGAAAVTKLKAPRADEIERIFNYKYPYEYISAFSTVIERKKRIEAFYER